MYTRVNWKQNYYKQINMSFYLFYSGVWFLNFLRNFFYKTNFKEKCNIYKKRGWNLMFFKRSVTRDFRHPFFSWFDPSGPLINRVKNFQILFRFRQDISIFKKLCGVYHTAESSSEVCIILRSQTPQCASYGGVRLHGVHHTAESDCEVFITPQSHENKVSERTQQCASHCGVMKTKYLKELSGVHPTTESWKQSIWKNSAVCIPLRSQFVKCLTTVNAHYK